MMPIFGFLDSPFQVAILLALAVVLFGARLPEVGRSLGKGLAEFKKGLKGIEDDIEGNQS
jgi:sec-independent protein translocase protein TatA